VSDVGRPSSTEDAVSCTMMVAREARAVFENGGPRERKLLLRGLQVSSQVREFFGLPRILPARNTAVARFEYELEDLQERPGDVPWEEMEECLRVQHQKLRPESAASTRAPSEPCEDVALDPSDARASDAEPAVVEPSADPPGAPGPVELAGVGRQCEDGREGDWGDCTVVVHPRAVVQDSFQVEMEDGPMDVHRFGPFYMRYGVGFDFAPVEVRQVFQNFDFLSPSSDSCSNATVALISLLDSGGDDIVFENPRVIAASMGLLVDLAEGFDCAATFVDFGGVERCIQRLCQALEAGDSDTTHLAVSLLGAAAVYGGSSSGAWVSTGAIETMIRAYGLEDMKVKVAAVVGLSALVADREECEEAAMEAGFISVVLDLLLRGSAFGHRQAILQASAVLRRTLRPHRRVCALRGCVESLLLAVTAGPKDASFHLQLLAAIQATIAGDVDHVDTFLDSSSGRISGADTMLVILDLHKGDLTVAATVAQLAVVVVSVGFSQVQELLTARVVKRLVTVARENPEREDLNLRVLKIIQAALKTPLGQLGSMKQKLLRSGVRRLLVEQSVARVTPEVFSEVQVTKKLFGWRSTTLAERDRVLEFQVAISKTADWTQKQQLREQWLQVADSEGELGMEQFVESTHEVGLSRPKRIHVFQSLDVDCAGSLEVEYLFRVLCQGKAAGV